MPALASAVRAHPATTVAPLVATLAESLRVLSDALKDMTRAIDEDGEVPDMIPSGYELYGMHFVVDALRAKAKTHSKKSRSVLPDETFGAIDDYVVGRVGGNNIMHADRAMIAANLVGRCAERIGKATYPDEQFDAVNHLAAACDFLATAIESLLTHSIVNHRVCVATFEALVHNTPLSLVEG